MIPKKPKIKKVGKAFKKSGAPAKGYQWAEQTSGRIPDPKVIPVGKKSLPKPKAMRTIASGTTGSGKVRVTEKRRSL